jgi:hypothetical protein
MSYKSSILPISLALAWASSAQAAFNPIPLQSGSYTHDMIVEKTASSPALPGGATTASMDGGINNDGDTWNEQGYFTSDTSVGLPPAGSTLTTNKYSYTFASTYAGPNAIVLDTGHFTNANWKLSSPLLARRALIFDKRWKRRRSIPLHRTAAGWDIGRGRDELSRLVFRQHPHRLGCKWPCECSVIHPGQL